MAPLVRNQEYFTPRWQAGLQDGVGSFMPATITIFVPGPVTYDAQNKPVTTKTVVYSGKARVQPVRATSTKQSPGDSVEVQQVRFQVPVNQTVLVPDKHQVEVTACPLNSKLLIHTYQLKTVVDSSNPFETTFEAQVVTNYGKG